MCCIETDFTPLFLGVLQDCILEKDGKEMHSQKKKKGDFMV